MNLDKRHSIIILSKEEDTVPVVVSVPEGTKVSDYRMLLEAYAYTAPFAVPEVFMAIFPDDKVQIYERGSSLKPLGPSMLLRELPSPLRESVRRIRETSGNVDIRDLRPSKSSPGMLTGTASVNLQTQKEATLTDVYYLSTKKGMYLAVAPNLGEALETFQANTPLDLPVFVLSFGRNDFLLELYPKAEGKGLRIQSMRPTGEGFPKFPISLPEAEERLRKQPLNRFVLLQESSDEASRPNPNDAKFLGTNEKKGVLLGSLLFPPLLKDSPFSPEEWFQEFVQISGVSHAWAVYLDLETQRIQTLFRTGKPPIALDFDANVLPSISPYVQSIKDMSDLDKVIRSDEE